MREYRLIDVVNFLQKQIPEGSEDKAEANLTLDQKITATNVEALYGQTIRKLFDLSYCVDAANSFKHRPELFATKDFRYSVRSYRDFDESQIAESNKMFSHWAATHAVREFLEFFKYYLLQIYEVQQLIAHSNKPLTAQDMEGIKTTTTQFDKMNINEKLSQLKRVSKIKSQWTDCLASLNNARNILAHFDGYVQISDCKESGTFSVQWPVNKYFLYERNTSNKKRWDKVPKPFQSDHYSKVEIHWLQDRVPRQFKPGDKIQFSLVELYELLFFFVHAINEIHEQFVAYAASKGIPTKDFEAYKLNLEVRLNEEGKDE